MLRPPDSVSILANRMQNVPICQALLQYTSSLIAKEPLCVLFIEHLTMQHVASIRFDELYLEMMLILEQQLGESVRCVNAPGEVRRRCG